MEKNKFRAVIKHLYMKDLTLKEIKAELDNVHRISAPAFMTVYNWVNEFKRSRISTCDAPRRSERPIETVTSEIIKSTIKSTILFWSMCAWKCNELVEVTGISHDIVISILQQLSKKLSARWVPRLLTVDHVTISKQCLKMFQRNLDEFLRRFITGRNMDPLLHTRDEETVKTIDFTGWTSEEDEDSKGQKGDGHSFLGCTRYNSYRLPSVEANDQWRLLRNLIGPFNTFKKKNVPIWRRRKCSSIKIMHRFIHAQHRSNSTNSVTNCFSIQHIRQI